MNDVFNGFSSEEALAELRRRNIEGPVVHLLDVLPLAEMAWADGVIHESERRVVLQFVTEHLERLARAGVTVAESDAVAFVGRWLDVQPTLQELRELRELLRVLFLRDDPARAHRILTAAMRVGAASPSKGEAGQIWDAREVQCMWELEDGLKPHLIEETVESQHE